MILADDADAQPTNSIKVMVSGEGRFLSQTACIHS